MKARNTSARRTQDSLKHELSRVSESDNNCHNKRKPQQTFCSKEGRKTNNIKNTEQNVTIITNITLTEHKEQSADQEDLGNLSDTGKALQETPTAIKEPEEERTFFKELDERTRQEGKLASEEELNQELKLISSPFPTDEDQDMNVDRSENQKDTQEAKEEVEEASGSARVKVEPGTLVMTAEAFRKFLAENTGLGKTPIDATDEREYMRILKKQFTKNLEPYKTLLNTCPFDEETASSVFIALFTEERNRAHLFKHNDYQLHHIKVILQSLAWQEDFRKKIEPEIIDKLSVVLDRPLKEFVGMVGRASDNMKANLETYNRDREKEDRQVRAEEGFLSGLWGEREMDASNDRIKMLTENSKDLTKELDSKTRSLNEAIEQVSQLKKARR